MKRTSGWVNLMEDIHDMFACLGVPELPSRKPLLRGTIARKRRVHESPEASYEAKLARNNAWQKRNREKVNARRRALRAERKPDQEPEVWLFI